MKKEINVLNLELMRSNREVFQDQREQEAINNPLDFQQPEEQEESINDWLEDYKAEEARKYKEKYGDLPYRLNLEARANDYNAKIQSNRLAKYGDVDQEFIDLFYGKRSVKMDKPLVYHNHARPLTDFQKLHFVSEPSQETKDLNIKNIKDGFKNLRQKS